MYTVLGSNTKICAECCGGCNWSRLTKAFVAVCTVVTWPIAVPVYGAVWLLSVVAASDAINKFTDNYWFVISLRFLNSRALAAPEPERQSPPPHADTKMDLRIDPWESSHFSIWDDPTVDDYVTSTLEGARRLGECFDNRYVRTHTRGHDYTLELLHACRPGKFIADTLITGYINAKREVLFNIWRYCTQPICEDGCDYIVEQISTMDREEQIMLLNYLHRYYPDSADGYLQKLIERAKAKNKFWENYRDIANAKDKFLENYRDIVKATPKERINQLFDGNGKPTDECMNFPPPFVAEVWKARQQDIGQLVQSMNMDTDLDILRTLHILHGFPIAEVVDALKTLPDKDLARLLQINSIECGHLWAVHIFMRMDLARAKKILSEYHLPLETIFMFVDTMRRKNPQRYAEIFSLVPDKDPPIGNLLYVHILNMPVDAAV
ncbi:MAG: hypothetical protein LBD72_02000, partial [Puniceicoccales bacterium]|nr:hypothetical protein [Puniceicoccales bacterium]